MPLVHVRTAAKLTQRHRSTITRAIEKGRLSAMLGDDGRYLIDPAELERVFGRLAHAAPHAQARTGAVHTPAQASARIGDAFTLEREVALLREQLERERLDRERERQGFEDERRFLRGLVERHGEEIRLLSQPPAPARRRWWPWRGAG